MKKAILSVLGAAGLWASTAALAVDNIEGLAMTCNNCHGTAGVSVGLSMPSIGGLPEAYLKNVMLEWKTGKRASANMTRLIKGYTDEEIAALASYYAKLPWQPQVQHLTADMLKSGKAAAKGCENCHGSSGASDEDDTPHLNGQWSKYMELELEKYRDGAFAMPHKKMGNAARKLPAEQVQPAAQYYGAQGK